MSRGEGRPGDRRRTLRALEAVTITTEILGSCSRVGDAVQIIHRTGGQRVLVGSIRTGTHDAEVLDDRE